MGFGLGETPGNRIRASTQSASRATSAAASSWRVSRETRPRKACDVDMIQSSTRVPECGTLRMRKRLS